MDKTHKDIQNKDLQETDSECRTVFRTTDDPRLMKIMAAWNDLDEATKQVMMRLID